MGDRIRQLEEALENSHGSSHPHLRPDLLLIRSPLELYNDAQTGHSLTSPYFGNQGAITDEDQGLADDVAWTQYPQVKFHRIMALKFLNLRCFNSPTEGSRLISILMSFLPWLKDQRNW
jgi:hypothetical protein